MRQEILSTKKQSSLMCLFSFLIILIVMTESVHLQLVYKIIIIIINIK